jgi:hypothetical protein
MLKKYSHTCYIDFNKVCFMWVNEDGILEVHFDGQTRATMFNEADCVVILANYNAYLKRMHEAEQQYECHCHICHMKQSIPVPHCI